MAGSPPGWNYYRPLTDGNGTALSNFAAKVRLTSANFDFSLARPDGADLRVWDDTAGALVPSYLVSFDAVAQTAELRFKATATANSHQLYFGNPEASSSSSFANVFTNGSGFDGASMGDLTATTSGSGAVTALAKASGIADARYRRVLVRSAVAAIPTSAIASRPVVREMSLLTDPDGNIVQESGEYVAYFIGQGAAPNYGQTYRATSADLVTWTVNTTPVIALGSSGDFDDQGARVATAIKVGTGDYRIWYTANSSNASLSGVGYATSTDGTNWTKVGSLLTASNCGITVYTPILSGVPDVKRILDGTYVMFCEARPSTGSGYPWSVFGWTSPDITGGGTWTAMNSGGYVINGNSNGLTTYGTANPHFWERGSGDYLLYCQAFTGSGSDVSTFNGQGAFWTASSPSGPYTVDSFAPIFGCDNTVSNFGEEAGGLSIDSDGQPVLFIQDYSIAADHLNTASNLFRAFPVTSPGGMVLSSATTGGALLTRQLAAGNFTAESRSIPTCHRSTNSAPYVLGLADSASAPAPNSSGTFAGIIRAAIRRSSHASASPGDISILYSNTSGTLLYYDGATFTSNSANTCGSSDMDREIVATIGDSGTTYEFAVSYADTDELIVSVSVAKSSVKGFTNNRHLFAGDPFTNTWQAGTFFRLFGVRAYAATEPDYSVGSAVTVFGAPTPAIMPIHQYHPAYVE